VKGDWQVTDAVHKPIAGCLEDRTARLVGMRIAVATFARPSHPSIGRGAGRSCFEECNQLGCAAVEWPSEFHQRSQCRLTLAALQHADVVPLQLCLEAQLLLRQPSSLAQLAQDTSEGDRNVQFFSNYRWINLARRLSFCLPTIVGIRRMCRSRSRSSEQAG
jgi:hypothetical protein